MVWGALPEQQGLNADGSIAFGSRRAVSFYTELQLTKKKILIVVDDPGSDWAAGLLREVSNDRSYYLLTFGFAPGQAFLRYESEEQELRAHVAVLETNKISHRAEEEARRHYLRFIRELPGQKTASGTSIADILSYRGRNLWWYLGITEKNIWLDKLIHHLYSLRRFQYVFEEAAYDEVHLWLHDDALCAVISDLIAARGVTCLTAGRNRRGRRRAKGSTPFIISYFLLICREFIKLLLMMISIRLAGIRERDLPKDDSVGFFSVYPLWWKDPFSEGATELIFQNVALDVEREKPVRHLLWFMPGHVLFQNKKGFAAFAQKRRVFVLNSLLGAADILSVLDPRLFMKFLKAFRIACRNTYEMEGIDISPLAREDIFRSFTSRMFFPCLLLDRCLQRVNLTNLGSLFFRLEFQPLERALLYNTRGNTRTIGFQHSALGRNFLNYVFEEDELGAHWHARDRSESMPLPDSILTSGEKGIEYMRWAGYPPEQLAIGGAVRLAPLYAYRKSAPSRQELRKRHGIPADSTVIFAATSPLLQESICMLDDLVHAVRASAGCFYLVVKYHPNAHSVPGYICKIAAMMDHYRKDISLEVHTGPIALYDYISLSNAVLLTGGTVAMEAMFLGCIPMIYINDAQFSHNPMTEYPEAAILVDGRQAMEAAMKTICEKETVEAMKKHWEQPLHDMFCGLEENPSDRFMRVLKDDLRILGGK